MTHPSHPHGNDRNRWHAVPVPELAWVVVALAAPLNWWTVAVGGRRREWASKPLVLVALVVAALFMGAAGSAVGWWLLAALVLSLAGDVALLSDSEPRFVVGLAGFLLSAGKTAPIRLAIVTLPGEAGSRLAARALDNRLALGLLSPRYSASAYAFATRYQNCNQWVAELMGFAWQPREDDAPTPDRVQAQRALRALGYDPTPVVVPSHAVMFAAQFVPLIHSDDHPLDDLYAMRLKVSTPAALEAFVHQRVPQAQRIELCATAGEIVVRRGWQPLPPDCRAAPGDEVLPLAS